MLKNQHNFQNKKRLCFKTKGKNKKNSKKSYKTTIKRYFGFINSYYCNQRGNHIKDYPYRNGTYVLRPNEKLLWLPKALKYKSHSLLYTNFVGLKITQVPLTME